MFEKERPLGVKFIFIGNLLTGIIGLFISIFGSTAVIDDIIFSDHYILRFIGNLSGSIDIRRALILIFSIFALWLSYIIFTLKKIAWYILLFLLSLPIAILIANLIVIRINNITLENIQKLGIAVGFIIDLFWFCYVITVKHNFIY